MMTFSLRAFALAATVTVPLAFAWTLKTYYTGGFAAMPIGQRGTSMVGSQIYWSYQNLTTTMDNPTGTDWAGVTAMGVGAAVTLALAALRYLVRGHRRFSSASGRARSH